jgi:hypothetical protein
MGALTGLSLLAALWSAPAAVAQVSLPEADDVKSQVEDAGDQIKDTVDGTVDEVKDAVEGAGDTVKDAVQDPAGTVNGTTGTVTETVGGSQEQSGGTTNAGSAGSSTTAASAGSAVRQPKKKERRGPAGDRQRRGKKSATEAKAESDVEELISGGNEISGAEVAGTRIQSGGEEGGGSLSLTGAALLAYLVVGAALLSAGSVLVRWARERHGPEGGPLLEGPGR